MMYLYEINASLDVLYNMASTGEIQEGWEHLANEDGTINMTALQAEIENLYACKDEIIEDTAHLVQNLEAEAKMIKAEEERLCARRKRLESYTEYVEDRLTSLVNATNWNSKKSCLKIAFRTSEALIVDNEAEIDPAYVITKTVTQVDKMAAKKAIKAGQELAGCHIEKRKNLSIK